MKISYNWLKQYLQFDLSPEKTAEYLTSSGLEVESIEVFETVKGGLKGLVLGEVLSCEKHPEADRLSITSVEVGAEQPLNIVCGAPNVAKGQKVIVATIGTILYSGDESFTIKKSKIRGVFSEGMICAEDEIGLGESHEGIMVLDKDALSGTQAADYFKIREDFIFEIGLTPNRSDAISHIGVARDLHAVLKINKIPCSALMLPDVWDFSPDAKKDEISITVENSRDCPRYTGLSFENITVKESPDWLKDRLRSIGIRPINNLVDITQYVMFEIGQPLHAFDADKIKGNKVIVKNLPQGTPFVTLDGKEIKLDETDLMICNEKEGMCIAGVYGGLGFGVSKNTKNLFLESAYFHPVSIRKTSKRHGLKTDAAFRYERGCDPEITVYAIKRAANLIKELAGGTVSSEIIDVYPSEIEENIMTLHFDEINRIAGKEIEKQIVSDILLLLDMEVKAMGEEQLKVTIPLYRTDVTRPIDLIEEILRIYGYNNIEIPDDLTYNIHLTPKGSSNRLKNILSAYLADNGFYEAMNNSLTKGLYAQVFDFIDEKETVHILNPLSNELSVMRQSLMLSGLENVALNLNNKNSNLKLFEFGKTYHRNIEAKRTDLVTERFTEKSKLGILITGKMHENIWNSTPSDLDFYYLKNIVWNLFVKVRFPIDTITVSTGQFSYFLENLTYLMNGIEVAKIGEVHPKVLKHFDIKKTVFYAEINLDMIYPECGKEDIQYVPLPLYPAVKRDLAVVIDKQLDYATLEAIAYKYGSKLLKNVTLFDVYEGDKIEAGKKSYALNFVLQHPDKTLTDDEINKVMNKLIAAFEKEAGAKLR